MDASVWHDKNWMTCLVNNQVVKRVMSDKLLRSCTIHKVPPGSSVKVPPGADWNPNKIKMEPGDKVVLENLEIVRPMKGE